MKKKLVLARDSKKLPSKGKVVNILDTIQFSSLIIVGKKKYILLKLQLLSQIIFFVYFFVNLVPTLGFYNYMHGVYWVHTFNKLKVCITRFRYPAPALYFNWKLFLLNRLWKKPMQRKMKHLMRNSLENLIMWMIDHAGYRDGVHYKKTHRDKIVICRFNLQL